MGLNITRNNQQTIIVSMYFLSLKKIMIMVGHRSMDLNTKKKRSLKNIQRSKLHVKLAVCG